jgi:apolipoprotein N-acyltransferase
VLQFLGFVGFGGWPLALVSLVPLWLALERPGTGPGAAARLGLVFGLVACAGGYAWLWELVEVFLGGSGLLGGALWLAHASWFALRFALQAAAFCVLRRRGASPALAGVAPLVALEWLYPQLFPYAMGTALAERVALVQIADLGGPLLLTTLVALVNVAALEGVRALCARRRPEAGALALAGIALVASLGYGAWRERQLERARAQAPALRVGLVQANLAVLEKRREASRVHLDYLEETRALLAAGTLDLVVWPETVWTRGIQGPFPVSGELVRRELRVPLLFGAPTVQLEAAGRRHYNSALLIGADGVIRSSYDKNLLIPLAERLPLGPLLARLGRLLPHAQSFRASREVPPLSLGPWRISTPICYEAVSASFVRRMVREARPHLLVSLANDGWFGDSQEPRIHLALARLRAVEHRRYLVRATNSGISAVVDPTGRVLVRTGLLTREHARATVRLLEGRSLYERAGDWPGPLAALLYALPFARRPRRAGPGADESLGAPLALR